MIQTYSIKYMKDDREIRRCKSTSLGSGMRRAVFSTLQKSVHQQGMLVMLLHNRYSLLPGEPSRAKTPNHTHSG